MAIIMNKEELISHGNVEGRKIILDIIEYALKSINSYNLTKNLIRIENSTLYVNELKYSLEKIKNIYVVGGGKATFPIAQALDEILGGLIKKGIVNVKKGERRRLKHIKVLEAGHPVPDEDGLKGAQEILEIAKGAGEDDLVFCIITGGASALIPLPYEGITLEDKKRVNELLLKCGATIDEINAVRKHISAIKGGRLAEYIHPAELINFIVLDEVAGLPWGPSVPDSTTFTDSELVLKKYDLWNKIPVSVKNHIERGLKEPMMETPKQEDFRGIRYRNIVLADNRMLCEAAKERCRQLSLRSTILTTVLEGESREAGVILATIGKEVEARDQPVEAPCALIVGGETNVKIAGEYGKGGPSQELVLGSALKLDGNKRIVVASVDTDGTDGPTHVAGGVIDGQTVDRARKKWVDIYYHLLRHNAYHVLVQLGDTIVTGPTETNVMDLNIILVL